MELAVFALRVVVGGLLAAHGAQKLLGWFGGQGPAGTAGFFDKLGLRPARANAYAAGAAELGGGLLLAFGLLTPIAAAAIIAVMTTAIITVHFAKGLWNTEGGYEFNLVLIAAAFAVAGVGAGDWSLDNAIGLDLNGAGWAVGALAAGIAGGLATVVVGRGLAADRHRHRHSDGRGQPTAGRA